MNHERIATIWNVLLRAKLLKQITPTEVTAMMIGLKLARLAEDMHKDDSWVDIIGYALGERFRTMTKAHQHSLTSTLTFGTTSLFKGRGTFLMWRR